MGRVEALLTLWLRPWACLFVTLISTSVSSAQTDAAWLHWSPPPECPPKSHITGRIDDWLGGAPKNDNLRVEAALHWNEERWEVVVNVAFDGHTGTRAVAVTDCSEAAEFVAVAVVLAIDPALVESLQVPAGEAAVRPEEGNTERSVHTAVDAEGSQEKVAPLRAETAREGTRTTKPDLGDTGPERTNWAPHLRFLGIGSWGALPGPRLGAAAALGIEWGRWSISLGVDWFPAVTTQVKEADASVDFSLLSGRLTIAYLLLGPTFQIGPAVSFQAGMFRAEQEGGLLGRVDELWLSLDAGALATLDVLPFLKMTAALQLEVPLTYPHFVLTDGTHVHQVHVGGSCQLGAQFSLDIVKGTP